MNKYTEEELVGMTAEVVEHPEMQEIINQGLGGLLGLVAEFNFVGEQNIYPAPVQQNEKDIKLTVDLIQEELNELKEALETGDKVAQLDAYIDLAYVLFGGVHKSGMMKEFVKGFLPVHINNMSKFQNGKAIFNEAGKIIKPEGYQPIDLGVNFPYLKNK